MPEDFSSEFAKQDEDTTQKNKSVNPSSLLSHENVGFDSPQVELENLLSFERVSKPATKDSFKLDLCEKKLKCRVKALCQFMTLYHIYKETNELWQTEPKEKVENILD